MSQIIPTAEPFLFKADSDVGCIVTHGFTGVPKEMRCLGEHLHKQGFNVIGPRLAGHATRPDDMIRTHYTDWLACVEDAFHLISGLSSHIYLVGLSMGAALSLTQAARLPVRGVAVMSAPFQLPQDWRLAYAEPLSYFIPFISKGSGVPGSSWFDQQAWQEHISYPKNPLRSIGQLNQLLTEMRAGLPAISVPVLLIHSSDDRYVLAGNTEQIYQNLTAPTKKVILSGSGHILPRDAQRETVFALVTDFVRACESGTFQPDPRP